LRIEGAMVDAVACGRRICALRAPTVFSVPIKSIRAENTVMDKDRAGLGWFPLQMEALQQLGREFNHHVYTSENA
jgi:hypothetical protein